MPVNLDTILRPQGTEKVANPTITTARLLLRPPRPDDLDFVHWLQSSPEATKWTKQGPSQTLADSQKALDTMLSSHSPMIHQLVVEILPTDDSSEPIPIGTAGSFRPRELGYGYHPDYYGKGYATEAAVAYCEWFRKQYPGERMFATSFPANEASVKVLEKCGFGPAREGEVAEWPVNAMGRATWIDRTLDEK